MTESCPDNSTDCLLREILQANSGYNWDPVTFGFTAVFTVIAFVVSIAALFQSFIAAGPGRLKASERAIGPSAYRKRTTTQFSWKEFRFRTIVNVPVFEVPKILEHVPTTIEIEHEEPPIISTKTRIVAGWALLIRDLSLGDVDFNTIECLTDYLPSDVSAAPAWAHVEVVVLMAIMKGCFRLIVNQEGFIDASGSAAQLSWNMHPTLGPMAIYRKWDIKETHTHTLEEVQRMIPVFRGDLYLSANRVLKLMPKRRNDIPVVFDFILLKSHTKASSDRCRHDHDHCLNRKGNLWASYLASKSQDEGDGVEKRTAALSAALFADRPANPKAFPSRLTKMHLAMETMYDEFFPWLMLADDLDDSMLNTICGTSFIEFNEWDANPDVSCLHKKENLVSWLAVAIKQVSSKLEGPYTIERPTLLPPDPVAKAKHLSKANQNISFEEIKSGNLRISRTAVQDVSRWLADDTSFVTSTPPEIEKARLWLSWQLAELDWFLSTIGDDAICAASNLVALGCIKFGLVHYTTIPRRFVLPETLDAFNLNWTIDPNDQGSVAVEGYLDKDTMRKLYTYTRTFIESNRKDLHTVKCTKTAQGYYYAMNKKHLPQTESSKPPAKSKPNSNDAMTEAHSPVSDRVKMPTTTEIKIRAVETHGGADSDHGSQSSSAETHIVTDAKFDTDLPELLGDPQLREWVRRTSASEDEIAVRVDPRVAALEALTFFRACVFGALLATGADTSPLLTSEKRYQLVQVS